jgi:hypothetical protein
MRTVEVPTPRWRPALDALSRTYDGAFVSIDIVGEAIGAQREVRNRPLHGISSDAGGITFFTGGAGMPHTNHRVSDPRRVWIEESDEGAVVALEVEGSDAVRTIMRFRSPVRRELLDRAVE